MNKVRIFPNLFTMANLCAGLFAITHLFEGGQEDFIWAARLILIALIFDVLDGHIARLTKSASTFGVNFDSLADLTTFGVAPAMLVYRFVFPPGDNVGLSLVVIYAGCTALRLARFNTTTSATSTRGKKPDFEGLPCPVAASVIAALVMCAIKFNLSRFDVTSHAVAIVMVLILSAMMVSKVRYPTIQRLGMESAKPFHYLVVALLLLGLGATYPPIAILLVSLTYVGYGIQGEFGKGRRRFRAAEKEREAEQESVDVK